MGCNVIEFRQLCSNKRVAYVVKLMLWFYGDKFIKTLAGPEYTYEIIKKNRFVIL